MQNAQHLSTILKGAVCRHPHSPADWDCEHRHSESGRRHVIESWNHLGGKKTQDLFPAQQHLDPMLDASSNNPHT